MRERPLVATAALHEGLLWVDSGHPLGPLEPNWLQF